VYIQRFAPSIAQGWERKIIETVTILESSMPSVSVDM